MKTFTASEYKLFEQLVGLRQAALRKVLSNCLKRYYPAVVETGDYIYCEGTIPIALVAHMDTVFKDPATEVFYDTHKNVIISPQGLGADDRAGVFAILRVVQAGLRPHIIFTTDEEKGCLGAEKLSSLDCPFDDLRYIIELDRRGADDCVFYDCDNKDFIKYVESFGFVEAWGSFTDICCLMPAWGIAGVNLSVGYRDEHSQYETLWVSHLLNTIDKVTKMLSVKTEDIPQFEYIESKWSYNKLWNAAYGYDDWGNSYGSCGSALFASTHLCDNCERHFLWEELIPIFGLDRKTQYYCCDCISSAPTISWCEKCGNAFTKEIGSDEKFCYLCRKGYNSND